MFSRILCVMIAFGLVPPVAMAQKLKPKIEELKTDDGVDLSITYYPSEARKDACPVVLLADWKDSRSVFDSLAKRLQSYTPKEGEKKKSFAVVTVDLRGHGDSTKQKVRDEYVEIDAAKIDRRDLEAMVRYDMEAVWRFLRDKNDDGQLNLNALSVVGAGMGASVAVNWAAADWSKPRLQVGKQGQDVKALVLISPEWKYKGLTMLKALRMPAVREQLAVCMMYGKLDKSHDADVKRIHKQLERFHPKPKDAKPDDPHDLLVLPASAKLQGTKLLKAGKDKAEVPIVKFLVDNVLEKEHEWIKHKFN